jgi:SAM-dependent methyltransferase
VDAFENCKPDVLWDLNETPLPFDDDSVDLIKAKHVFEHLKPDRWWSTFYDCARILKVGGVLERRCPHDSSSSAATYRDHNHVLTLFSFHGTKDTASGGNAWAELVDPVPMKLKRYELVPFQQYTWMLKLPWLLNFCAQHLRNFIWEQGFFYEKFDPKEIGNE